MPCSAVTGLLEQTRPRPLFLTPSEPASHPQQPTGMAGESWGADTPGPRPGAAIGCVCRGVSRGADHCPQCSLAQGVWRIHSVGRQRPVTRLDTNPSVAAEVFARHLRPVTLSEGWEGWAPRSLREGTPSPEGFISHRPTPCPLSPTPPLPGDLPACSFCPTEHPSASFPQGDRLRSLLPPSQPPVRLRASPPLNSCPVTGGR